MKILTYIQSDRMSFREGSKDFNFHIRWWNGFYFYIYIFGYSFWWPK